MATYVHPRTAAARTGLPIQTIREAILTHLVGFYYRPRRPIQVCLEDVQALDLELLRREVAARVAKGPEVEHEPMFDDPV
jgi:hypothetical protein